MVFVLFALFLAYTHLHTEDYRNLLFVGTLLRVQFFMTRVRMTWFSPSSYC
jgi:hypothetical protein